MSDSEDIKILERHLEAIENWLKLEPNDHPDRPYVMDSRTKVRGLLFLLRFRENPQAGYLR